VFVWLCACACTCVRVRACECVFCVWVCVYVYECVYVCVRVRVRVRARVRVCVRVCGLCACVWSVYACVECVSVCGVCACVWSVCACACICVRARVPCVCACVRVCVHFTLMTHIPRIFHKSTPTIISFTFQMTYQSFGHKHVEKYKYFSRRIFCFTVRQCGESDLLIPASQKKSRF